MLTGLSLALPGALLCNATHRLGDRQRVILRQRVRGSIRAIRAVWNTRVFQMETRVVADAVKQAIKQSFKQALHQAFNCQRVLMRTHSNSVYSTSIITVTPGDPP